MSALVITGLAITGIVVVLLALRWLVKCIWLSAALDHWGEP